MSQPNNNDVNRQWIGDIPDHWLLVPIKAISTCNDEVLNESTSAEYEIEYVEISDVNEDQGIVNSIIIPFSEAPSRARRRVKNGDVIVSTVRTYLRAIASIKNPAENMIVSTGFAVIRPRSVNPSYVGYVFRAEFLIAEVISRSVGVSYPAINSSELMRIKVPIPPPSEQAMIARFLDHQTAKIKELVVEQENLIALLKEKRQSIISHAVTKGLDPMVPMKDSGMKWLGQMPASWEKVPIKRVISEIDSGTSVNAIDTPALDNEIAVLKVSCVSSGRFIAIENKIVIPEEIDRVTCPVKNNKLIVSRANTPELVGAAGLVLEEAYGLYLSDKLWQISFSGAEAAYIYYWTQTAQYRLQVKMVCTGASSSMQNISREQFQNFILLLPPPQEQQKIVEYLNHEIGRIDSLINEAIYVIDLLKERRTALISAAVTGKIDVRSLVEEVTA